MSRPLRVAFLNTHPIQYFAPLYAYLNRSPDLEVTALYLADYSVRGGYDRAFGQAVKWDVDLLAGYEARFVAGADARGEPAGFWSMVVPQLWREIGRGRYDALVVYGHTPAAYLLGLLRAKLAGMRVFMRCDTHLELPRSRWKLALRRPLLRALYACCDGVLAIGSANAAFYRAMGVPDYKIFLMPFAVDNDRFVNASRSTREERLDLRRSLGVDDDRPIVLFAAKFQRLKRPDDLLRAAAVLAGEGLAFRLVMAGSGELDAELRALADRLGLSDVTFPGFVNQAALPRLYAVCDVFVLPSDNETWGLAVNEAMCAGMPIIASNAVGCARDLVRDGVNGYTYPAGDVGALTDALRPLLADASLRERFGAASRDLISGWSYAQCSTGLERALASTGLPYCGRDAGGIA